MTYVLFFGSLFVTFGPALALFLLVISRNNQLIILTIGGSFFWLLSVLVASIWWYIIPPLRQAYWFVIPFSVFFQELGRYIFYRLYAWAFYRQLDSRHREQITANPRLQSLSVKPNNVAASVAAGVGSGVTYALVMYISVLWESTGPGSAFSPACPGTSLFIISAILALGFVLLHIFQSIVAFEAFRLKSLLGMVVVWGSHIVASLLSLANLPGGSCPGSIVPIYLVMGGVAVVAMLSILRSNSLSKKE